MTEAERAALDYLRSPTAIRDRAGELLALARAGDLEHFAVDDSNIASVAERVVAVTRDSYPSLEIPYHSRWNHFHAGADRRASLPTTGPERVELVILSVLLDAGAGPTWKYNDGEHGTFARSEGLAVASLRMYESGVLRGTPAALASMNAEALASGFQVSEDNPLVGLEGRAALLRSLGAAISARPDMFGDAPTLGGLYGALVARAEGKRLPAAEVLGVVLDALGPIWPDRASLGGENLGDVWRHAKVGGQGLAKGWVPFHKLSQWLSYSLIESLEWDGFEITDLSALTGLAEYRNGGLLVDGDVLVPKARDAYETTHAPGDEFVVEWRALTVALLDEVAAAVRHILQRPELPLARILEGGTWATGRVLAKERRPDGSPPFVMASDGTVF